MCVQGGGGEGAVTAVFIVVFTSIAYQVLITLWWVSPVDMSICINAPSLKVLGHSFFTGLARYVREHHAFGRTKYNGDKTEQRDKK